MSEPSALLLVAALSLAVFALCQMLSPVVAPAGLQVLPLLVGGLLLGGVAMATLVVLIVGLLTVNVATLGIDEVRIGALVVVALVAAYTMELARSRDASGVTAVRSENMLVDLRRRLEAQGRVPPLPGGWHVDVALRPAYGSSFAGDFLVSAMADGDRLELVLVDVSGKGVDAGTRALLLSGAFGGLLGAVPGERFLPSANAYLMQQGWQEGFATAVHLAIDLPTGHYHVASAGHPPAAHFDAGSGRWELAEAQGDALGIFPEIALCPARGTLRPGDALLLYTDGLIEVPGRDLDVGIDRLLGKAERLVPGGFAASADVLVDVVAPAAGDDRTLVLLWRD